MKLKNIRIDDLCGFAVTDSENPRFTLETENELENAFISSYSLKVKSDEAVLWQTEEQSSTVDNIVYGGRALLPCTVYTVEATVCDNYGNKAEKTAEFETGFLSGDFPAEWITKPNYHVGFGKSPIPLVFKRQFLLSGKVILYGCPGEEGGAAKAFMARDGLWKKLDAASLHMPPVHLRRDAVLLMQLSL